MENCYKCGERLTPGARFCPGCGAHADLDATQVASEETRVAAPPRPRAVQPFPVQPLPVQPLSSLPERRADERGDEEKTIFTARPTLLFIKIGYALAALGGLLLIALLAWQPWLNVSFYVSLPPALALLLIPAYKHLKRNTVRYTLTDSKIEIDQGLIARTTRNIPLRNIQDVTTTTTIPQRLLRIGDVVIDNASETGGTTVLRSIPDPRRHADLILRALRRWR
jgi:membrane protein YdbS with pleckstrin-like domain